MRNPLIPRKAETPTPPKPLKPVGKLKPVKKTSRKRWVPGEETRTYLRRYGYQEEFIEDHLRKLFAGWEPHPSQLR